MAKLVYSATMSLDGFIAGPGGDVSWMTDLIGPNQTVDEMTGNIGAILVGGRTFGGDDPHRGTEHEGEPFSGAWSGPQFVLTGRPPKDLVPGITFFADLRSAVEAAKIAAGDKDVHVLGATVARSCLEAGVLDEIFVSVAPVMLGDGVRLFDHPGGTNVRLERIHLSEAPLATNIWMRLVR